VKRLVVIRGYRGDVLETFVKSIVPDAIFVDNNEWETNNVLLSLDKGARTSRSPDVHPRIATSCFTPTSRVRRGIDRGSAW